MKLQGSEDKTWIQVLTKPDEDPPMLHLRLSREGQKEGQEGEEAKPYTKVMTVRLDRTTAAALAAAIQENVVDLGQ